MQASPETEPGAASLLAIRGASGAWAIPSDVVASVEALSQDANEAGALDVGALLGAGKVEPSAASRVIVLQVRGERLQLLVHGALTLIQAQRGELLPLPNALATPLVSHVAAFDGKPTLWVLSPERLLEVAHAQNAHA